MSQELALILVQQREIGNLKKRKHSKIITNVKFEPEKDMFSFFTTNNEVPEFSLKRNANGDYTCSSVSYTWQRMDYTNSNNYEDDHETFGFIWWQADEFPRFLDMTDYNRCGFIVTLAVSDAPKDRTVYLLENHDIELAFIGALEKAKEHWNLVHYAGND